MRKCILIIVAGLLFITGCSVEKMDTEKLKDLEFTVVDEAEIPEELKSQIEEKKDTPLKLTYSDKGYFYIAQGYGAQKTSGYSIEVLEVYETKNAICMKTNLIGPDKNEEILEKQTYPFVVIKIEYNEKHVVFE